MGMIQINVDATPFSWIAKSGIVQWPHNGNRGDALERVVGAIAENWIGTVLATAEVDGLGFGRIEFYGREIASLVAAVAEGLAGASAAGTPVVALAGFNFDGIGALLGNRRF
jgi:hypothetical protein